jgi:flavin-binding protein dodecin
MAEIKVNIAFKNIRQHSDTYKRSDHVFDRMKLRGITKDNIKEAVQKGAKRIRADNSIIAEFRWFKVIYREFNIEDIRKIYPITVID